MASRQIHSGAKYQPSIVCSGEIYVNVRRLVEEVKDIFNLVPDLFHEPLRQAFLLLSFALRAVSLIFRPVGADRRRTYKLAVAHCVAPKHFHFTQRRAAIGTGQLVALFSHQA